MKLVALIFLLIPSALFAREVNTAFLWNAAVDTTGRVITGSTDETSGYWYAFDDGVYGGGGLPLGFGHPTSKKIFVETCPVW
ncbi:hypothetical protein [Fibrobacter intestinalis]|uniref:hypothetical protein n=1 Tax=Fibrobacter sp. NR9 TaxID=1896200 RepID=UPI000BB15461|nr:hypothetical protein [Fibrobacter sp. NR9]PBC74638.1 hypothetical protein BGW94_2305 [Fibrobacter sp. NR9]